jgi:hypothetical protein
VVRIIGYINQNQFLPCCVIILCQENEQNFLCFYPNGEKIPISNYESLLLQENNGFVREKNTKKLFNENDIAYLFPSNEVFVGNVHKLKERLFAELAKADLHPKEKEIIVEFMQTL